MPDEIRDIIASSVVILLFLAVPLLIFMILVGLYFEIRYVITALEDPSNSNFIVLIGITLVNFLLFCIIKRLILWIRKDM